MKQLKQIINKVVEWTSIGLVVVMVLLVLWQVVARYLLNNPSSFSEALTRYLFVWLVLITSTYAFGSRDHMYIAALNDLNGMPEADASKLPTSPIFQKDLTFPCSSI